LSEEFWKKKDQMFRRVSDMAKGKLNVSGEKTTPLPCDNMTTYKLDDCPRCPKYKTCGEGSTTGVDSRLEEDEE
jgi:hypothetical protein